MARLAVTGQNVGSSLTALKPYLSRSLPLERQPPSPAGTGPKLVQQSCAKPFPVLKTDRKFKIVKHTLHMCSHPVAAGKPTTIPECINGDTNIADCPFVSQRTLRKVFMRRMASSLPLIFPGYSCCI